MNSKSVKKSMAKKSVAVAMAVALGLSTASSLGFAPLLSNNSDFSVKAAAGDEYYDAGRFNYNCDTNKGTSFASIITDPAVINGTTITITGGGNTTVNFTLESADSEFEAKSNSTNDYAPFAYIAKGVERTDANGDIVIDWSIKAWPDGQNIEASDMPTTVDAAEAAWEGTGASATGDNLLYEKAAPTWKYYSWTDGELDPNHRGPIGDHKNWLKISTDPFHGGPNAPSVYGRVDAYDVRTSSSTHWIDSANPEANAQRIWGSTYVYTGNDTRPFDDIVYDNTRETVVNTVTQLHTDYPTFDVMAWISDFWYDNSVKRILESNPASTDISAIRLDGIDIDVFMEPNTVPDHGYMAESLGNTKLCASELVKGSEQLTFNRPSGEITVAHITNGCTTLAASGPRNYTFGNRTIKYKEALGNTALNNFSDTACKFDIQNYCAIAATTAPVGESVDIANTRAQFDYWADARYSIAYGYSRAIGAASSLPIDLPTVLVPEIANTVATGENGSKIVDYSTTAKITDRVTYEGLEAGKTYQMRSVLMDKATDTAITTSATTSFIPTAANGFVDVELTFDSTAYAGKSIVVYETIIRDGADLCWHKDISDADQTVTIADAPVVPVPAITSTVATAEDGTKTVPCAANAKIIDRVNYADLTAGTVYTMTTSVVDKATGNAVVADMNSTFTATAATGYVDVTITLDTTALENKNLVIYETISLNGVMVCEHKNINDAQQTVGIGTAPVVPVPAITSTVATNSADNGKTVPCSAFAKIIDRVNYVNLEAGKTYTVKTSVVEKTTGAEVTSTQTILNPTAADGYIDIEIPLDTLAYEGKHLVVYETILRDGTIVCEHKDINDAQQTVGVGNAPVVPVPAITSTVATAEDGTKTVPCAANAKIIDRVNYADLTAGTAYTLTTSVVDKATGNVVFAGTPSAFIAPAAAGYIDVTITLDTTALEGKNLVVYEEISLNGVAVCSHKDINDAQQTVGVGTAPVVPTAEITSTVATNPDNGSKTIAWASNAKIVDRVNYKGLEAGKMYVVTTSVMDKATGNAVVNGLTSFFTASAAEGYVDVTITLDTLALADKELVVYETISRDSVDLCSHKDINDAGQTVKVDQEVITLEPTIIKTVATNDVDGAKNIACSETSKIVDRIYYDNLEDGKTYTVTSTVVEKTTGKAVVSNATSTFKASSATGYVDVTITANTKDYAEKSLVVYETISLDGVVLCEHKDIDDAYQTVIVDKLNVPKVPTITQTLATNATGVDNIENNYTWGVGYNKTVPNTKNAIINDRVYYSYLEDGVTYKVTATMYDAVTGVVLSDIKPVSVTFVANSLRGYIDVQIPLDATKYAGKSLVVFESITTLSKDGSSLKEVEVCNHRDLNDVDQTVYVSTKTEIPTTGTIVKTVAAGSTTNSHALAYSKSAQINDTIYYKDLVDGQIYTVVSSVVDYATGTLVVNGQSSSFIADSTKGYTVANIVLDSTLYANRALVVYETIYLNNVEICSHKDINDVNQTVLVDKKPADDKPSNPDDKPVTPDTPVIVVPGSASCDSVAVDSINNTHTMSFSVNAEIRNRINYKGLEDGVLYTATSTVYDKATGSVVLNPVSKSFTADSKKGYVENYIPVDTTIYEGRTFVVFTSISRDGSEVCSHKEINDENATVRVAKIGTVLTADNMTSKTIPVSKNVTIVDLVRYEGLTPGETYKITGHILCKESSSGKDFSNSDLIIAGDEGSLVTNGAKVIATQVVEFTPSTANGTVNVTFNVNTVGLSGQHLVAFEFIADKPSDAIVGEHKDINDANQTVVIKTSSNVYTGGEDMTVAFAIGSGVCVLAAIAVAVVMVIRKRKLNK